MGDKQQLEIGVNIWCPLCNGKGKIEKLDCGRCKGTGIVENKGGIARPRGKV